MNRRTPAQRARSSFTLVEMLVVMAIIAVLAALTVSAYRSVNTALGLSSATQMVLSELTIARQTALTLDEQVQVRFYKYPDSTGASTTQEYQAMQAFGIKNSTTNALEKVIYLPPTIIISSSTTYSVPLSSATAITPLTSDPPLMSNGVGHSYTYTTVTFKPDGTIDPPPASWFITLYEKKYATSTPVNFTTVNVDPVNGRVRLFQP